jgi:hypothetical protein
MQDDLFKSLLSVGQAKLSIQAATSIGYDTQALGLMAVTVALAGVNVALTSDLGPLWWLPLAGLAASFAISIIAIAQPEIETGQNLGLAIAMGGTAEERHRLLLDSVIDAIAVNIDSLADKRGLITWATALIGLAFALLGVAQIVPVASGLITSPFA